MLMKSDINLLILDEPTNHLDIASREWIESAIADYGEALLFVSHDRWFIEKFATRVWELRDGRISDYRGGFTDFCAWRERQRSIEQAAARREEKPRGSRPAKKSPPRTERVLAKLERDIAALEREIAELDVRSEEFASDYQKLLEIGEQRAELDGRLNELYERWEELSE